MNCMIAKLGSLWQELSWGGGQKLHTIKECKEWGSGVHWGVYIQR